MYLLPLSKNYERWIIDASPWKGNTHIAQGSALGKDGIGDFRPARAKASEQIGYMLIHSCLNNSFTPLFVNKCKLLERLELL